MLINDSVLIKQGNSLLFRVYQGDTIVWELNSSLYYRCTLVPLTEEDSTGNCVIANLTDNYIIDGYTSYKGLILYNHLIPIYHFSEYYYVPIEVTQFTYHCYFPNIRFDEAEAFYTSGTGGLPYPELCGNASSQEGKTYQMKYNNNGDLYITLTSPISNVFLSSALTDLDQAGFNTNNVSKRNLSLCKMTLI